MKKLGIVAALILGLVLVLSAAGAAWAEDEGGRTYPGMRPDRETLEEWIEAYNNAPRAYIRMEGFEVPSLAGSLDLLDHLEYDPYDRNQGSCGNCWAWAGTGVMEIALDVQEGIEDRLSVQYINSCQTGEIGKACCYGGWLFDLADFYTATGMAIPWSNTNAYWQSGDGSCGPVCGTISTAPNYPIAYIEEVTILTQGLGGGEGMGSATAIANIKSVLQQDRAVWFGFFMPNSAAWSNFTGFWGGSDESVVYDIDQFCGTSYTSGLGHAVLCVGYNDTDTDNRYWVMLNSWGTDYGGRPNGLFRINMDMNYDCQYPGFGGGIYAFYWQTLDVAFGGTPDLVVEKSVEISGGNFTVSYNVSNMGDATANASTTGKYVNGTLMESQPCPALVPGGSYSGQFDPEPCPCGESLNVTVCADNEYAVAESNEANNCEINIVECPATPDIRVSPSGFNVTLPRDTTQDYTLTIGNDGDTALTYNISDRETTGGGSAVGSEKHISSPGTSGEEAPPTNTGNFSNPYLVRTFVDEEGREIAEVIFPGRPPEIKAPAATVPEPNPAMGINVLPNMPAFNWSYGCSATSAAMMMGYYDNTGYPNMYTGPTNGGVCPMDNSVWGQTSWPSIVCVECPLSATHQGVDGRIIKGHVNDYWIDFRNADPDPFIGNWTEHTQGDCTGDFMGTSQSNFNNTDGSTRFYFDTSGDALYDYTGCEPSQRDGCHGLRLFAESRSYVVLTNFSQRIKGQGSDPSKGFTFSDFQAEIDAGRPVLIQVVGHTMLGYGYNDPDTVYLHNTWDYSSHSMTWGGTYSGLQHFAVSVIQMEADCPWLDEDPKSGPVGPGGSQNITVSINTTGLGSDYSAEIVIASNDPDEDPVIVPVTLHVTSPDLVVSKSVEISGGNFTVSYNVSNIGNAAANASTTCKYVNGTLMESQPCPPLGPGQSHSGQFDPEPCPCGESLNVTVCADNGDAVDESNEANNCEINIVDCPATPDIWVFPGGFNVTLPPNTTQDYTLTIGNDGCAALSYNISDREAAVDCPWLSESPASGSVGPGGSQNISVSINTTGLGSDYSAEIVIASNDPDEDPVIVPVALHVGWPVISYNITLAQGWNLISWPLIPASSNITDVLAGISGDVAIVYHYDAQTWTWLWYIPGTPASTLTTMDDGWGYWIFMNSSAALNVSGQEMPDPPAPPPAYDVVLGWNLIGFKSVIDMPHETYLASIIDDYSLLYGWEPGEGYFCPYPGNEHGGNMESGHGYWLWMNESGTIVPP